MINENKEIEKTMKKSFNTKTQNTFKGIDYVWFHHCVVPHEIREFITQVIEHHDWDNFVAIYNLMKATEPDCECVFLPSVGYIEEDGEIKEVDILRKENFFRIRVCDCECG